MRKRIFLDYAAGKNNPNAIYKEGREVRARLESARARVARVLSAATDEIIFTQWGTEANVLALMGLTPKSHTVTTQIEHPSLLDALKGKEVTYLAPNADGFIAAKQVSETLRPNTKLVSIMYANNEIGTIQPIKEIARMLRNRKPVLAPSEPREAGQSRRSRLAVPAQMEGSSSAPRLGTLSERASRGLSRPIFHSDCVQAPGLLSINMQSLGVDMASFSSSKFGGPTGAGFLYVRRGTPIYVRDSGPIDLVEEMADKLEEVEKKREKEVVRLTKLRDYFIADVLKNISTSQLNGSQNNRLANNANFVFPIEAELLVLELDAAGVAASAGAACNNENCEEGSHVIMALGKTKDEANRSVRFSFGGSTSKSELDYVIKILLKIINKHKNIWQTR